jgi:hypothetical protein
MKPKLTDIGFLVGIFEDSGSGGYTYLGTGIVWGPRTVLTCSHIAKEGASLHVRRAHGDHAVVDRIVMRDATEECDLAVLLLDRDPGWPLATFVQRLTTDHLHHIIDSERLLILSWDFRISVVSPRLRTTPSTDPSDEVMDALFECQLKEGMSGTPALCLTDSQWLVLGLFHKGGLRVDHARLIAATRIRAFLGPSPEAIATGASNDQTPNTAVEELLHRLSSQLRSTQQQFCTAITNFIDSYLGPTQSPEPFGGREAELRELNAWLHSPASPRYLLILGDTGVGKSALLVRWITYLRATQSKTRLIYVPVSIRFRTNSEAFVLKEIAEQLAAAFGDTLSPGMPLDYRRLINRYLSTPENANMPLLIVLDGIDETAAWSVGADLFPLRPPTQLRVLVSARRRLDDQEGRAWLDELAWDYSGLARTMTLERFNSEKTRLVLQAAGYPAVWLYHNAELVTRIHDLCQGDPLLLSLYVKQFRERPTPLTELRIDDLAHYEPGLTHYLNRWISEQRLLWRTNEPTQFKLVQELLRIISCAVGPLSRTDLLQLLANSYESWELDDALSSMSRLVIGDRSEGYVFSHPRLAQHFREDSMDVLERRACDDRLLQWADDTVTKLVDGLTVPDSMSPYVVRFYHAHLSRAFESREHGTAPGRAFDPSARLSRLVSVEWCKAWLAIEEGYSGLLTDARFAWNMAHTINLEAIRNSRIPTHLRVNLRASLFHASVVGAGEHISLGLVTEATRRDMLSPRQGIALAASMRPHKRFAALKELWYLIPPRYRADVAAQMLDSIREFPGDVERLRAFHEVSSLMPQEVIVSGLACARKMKYDTYVADLLMNLVRHLSPEDLTSTFYIVQQFSNDSLKAIVLERVAPLLPSGMMTKAVMCALRIKDIELSASSLAPSLPRLSADRQLRVTKALLKLRRHERVVTIAVSEIEVLAKHLAKHLMARLFEFIARIEPARIREEAFVSIAPHLPSDLASKLFDDSKSFQHEESRVRAITSILNKLSDEQRRESLRSFIELDDEVMRASALERLVVYLPPDSVAQVWQMLLEYKRDSLGSRIAVALVSVTPPSMLCHATALLNKYQGYERRDLEIAMASRHATGSREDANNRISRRPVIGASRAAIPAPTGSLRLQGSLPISPSNVVQSIDEAYASALQAKPPSEKVKALTALFPRLPVPEQNAVLELFASIFSEAERATALAGISSHAPDEAFPTIWRRLMQFKDDTIAVALLRHIVSRLEESLLREALALALGYQRRSRVEATLILAPRLRQSSHSYELFARLLDRLCRLPGDYEKSELLSAIGPFLPPELAGRAFAIARRLTVDDVRAETIIQMLPHLPDEMHSAVLDSLFMPARQLNFQRERSKTLSLLAPRLSSSHLAVLVADASELENEAFRAQALCAILPHLRIEDRSPVIEMAIDCALDLRDDFSLAETIEATAPFLSQEQTLRALRLIPTMEQPYCQKRVIAAISSRLEPKDWTVALQMIQELPEPVTGAEATLLVLNSIPAAVRGPFLSDPISLIPTHTSEAIRLRIALGILEIGVGPWQRMAIQTVVGLVALHLPAHWPGVTRTVGSAVPTHLLKDLLDEVGRLDKESLKADFIIAIAKRLDAKLLEDAIWHARSMQSGILPHKCLLVLARQRPDSDNNGIVTASLEFAKGLADDHARLCLLELSVPMLSEMTSFIALEVALGTRGEQLRIQILVKLIERFPKSLNSNVLAVALRIDDYDSRECLFAAMASRLPNELLLSALKESQRIGDQLGRDRMISELVPLVPASGAAEAMALVTRIKDDLLRSQSVVTLFPHLPATLWNDVLAAVLSLGKGVHRSSMISGLAPNISPDQACDILPVIGDIDDETARTRALVAVAGQVPLAGWSTLCELLVNLTQESNVVQGICGIARYVPAMRAVSLLRKGLTVEDRLQRERVIVAIAPRLHLTDWRFALDSITVLDDRDRARVIAGIAEFVPAELLERVVGMVSNISRQGPRADALVAIAPKIPVELWPATLQLILAFKVELDRASVIARSIKAMPEVALIEVYRLVKRTSDAEAKAVLLEALSAYIPSRYCGGILKMSFRLHSKLRSVDIVCRLAPRLSGKLLRVAFAWLIRNDLPERSLRTFVSSIPPRCRGELDTAIAKLPEARLRYRLSSVADDARLEAVDDGLPSVVTVHSGRAAENDEAERGKEEEVHGEEARAIMQEDLQTPTVQWVAANHSYDSLIDLLKRSRSVRSFSRQDEYSLWERILREAMKLDRSRVTADFPMLVRLGIEIGDRDIALDGCKAIDDVESLWP